MQLPRSIRTALLAATLLALTSCAIPNLPATLPSDASGGTSGGAPSPAGPAPTYGQPSQSSGCRANGPLPDSACTPGDILPGATRDAICTSGYARSVRNVSVQEKAAVYSAYGIGHHSAGQYEVDHLISLELGGSNTVANLWPEAASPQPGFHEKDEIENYLHDQICSGAISLADAQLLIATNWIGVYQHVNSGAPLPVPVGPVAHAPPTEVDAASDSTQMGDVSGSGQPIGRSPPAADGSCSSGYPVKGNVRRDGTRIYHLPQEAQYARTHAEACFATAADAETAGFRAPRTH